MLHNIYLKVGKELKNEKKKKRIFSAKLLTIKKYIYTYKLNLPKFVLSKNLK